MSILTRYLIRSLVGPFLFSLGALTGLLFLNAVAQRLEMLVGKGLGWQVIAEFLVFTLPHTIALTLPAAVLIAVLYAFADLTSNSEVTAMSAGGVKPSQLLTPVLLSGAILAGVTYYFNDQVLPESNHQLKNLMIDIGNKSPTFTLREQIVNRIETGDLERRFYLQATQIDAATNYLRDVTIYDVSDVRRARTIYADSGAMAFNREQTDLYLTLYDGVVYETTDQREGALQRTAFGSQIIPIRGVADVLERSDQETRSDRELSILQLAEHAAEQDVQREQAQEETWRQSRFAVYQALGLSDDSTDTTGPNDDGRAGTPPTIDRHRNIDDDGITRGVVMTTRTSVMRADVHENTKVRYWVEIHKKLAISFACIVFVLLGVPVALRFPRGGVGMVISVSVGIFGIYWMGLIGGENLADKGALPPFWAMWTPNLVFFALALLLVSKIGQPASTTRGGGLDEILYAIRRPFLRRRANQVAA